MSNLERILAFLFLFGFGCIEERRVLLAHERAAEAERWAESVADQAVEMLEKATR